MSKREINVKVLKSAVNAILDHLVEDLGIENVAIEDEKDSSPTSNPYSPAKCSAVSVGPNRSCSVPEYFSRTSCSTLRRNFSGFARFELLPALRCCSPLAPSPR
jgi:hypothetical protein